MCSCCPSNTGRLRASLILDYCLPSAGISAHGSRWDDSSPSSQAVSLANSLLTHGFRLCCRGNESPGGMGRLSMLLMDCNLGIPGWSCRIGPWEQLSIYVRRASKGLTLEALCFPFQIGCHLLLVWQHMAVDICFSDFPNSVEGYQALLLGSSSYLVLMSLPSDSVPSFLLGQLYLRTIFFLRQGLKNNVTEPVRGDLYVKNKPPHLIQRCLWNT